LHLGELSIRSLPQMPDEESDETMFKIDCLNYWLPYNLYAWKLQIKKRFTLEEGFVAILRILDSVADQDLTKDPSLTTNVCPTFSPFFA